MLYNHKTVVTVSLEYFKYWFLWKSQENKLSNYDVHTIIFSEVIKTRLFFFLTTIIYALHSYETGYQAMDHQGTHVSKS